MQTLTTDAERYVMSLSFNEGSSALSVCTIGAWHHSGQL